jgi:endonuclease/exonuclease/phosphatase family metal-dependent hydrolase
MSRYPVSLERFEMTWGFGQTVRLEPGHENELSEPIEISNIHVAAPHMVSPLPGFYLRWRQARELDAYLKLADGRGGLRGPECGIQNRSESTSKSNARNVSAGQGSPTRPGSSPENTPANGKGPARLLVGDFNATSYWPWYWRMASQFTDAAVTVAEKTGISAKPTWGPWPGSRKLLRIDHGFLRGLEVREFEVFEIEGSDHSALVMDITLPV